MQNYSDTLDDSIKVIGEIKGYKNHIYGGVLNDY